ncbi:GNAT family N-acetyltransferase [Flavobacterium rhizosphaerae]|uniref:GNAT family N-acetyltransferase n=1 Tax=Flavobacterium rhizosphaerae TaxID=3163298 RepID=A0ABW8YXH8_9FLAO
MHIRKGKPEDMPAVLQLIKELAVFENEPDAVVITANDLVRDGFGTQPLFETFVAEKNNAIIGVALFYYRYSTWKGKTIHLEDLIVNQAHRGIGAGSGLYKAVIAHAKKQGLRRVEWAVLDWNTHAVDFYKRSGARVFDDWRTVQMDETGIANFAATL